MDTKLWKVVDNRGNVCGFVDTLQDMPSRGAKRVAGYVMDGIEMVISVPKGMGDRTRTYDYGKEAYVVNGTDSSIIRYVSVPVSAMILVNSRIHTVVECTSYPNNWGWKLASLKKEVARAYLIGQKQKYSRDLAEARKAEKEAGDKLDNLNEWMRKHPVSE